MESKPHAGRIRVDFKDPGAAKRRSERKKGKTGFPRLRDGRLAAGRHAR
jgi:hypothetical protein